MNHIRTAVLSLALLTIAGAAALLPNTEQTEAWSIFPGQVWQETPVVFYNPTGRMWMLREHLGDYAVGAAARTWNGAGADIGIEYGGVRTNHQANCDRPDGISTVGWGDIGSEVVMKYCTWKDPLGFVAEADIILNNRHMWEYAPDCVSAFFNPFGYEVESVVVNGFGAILGLDKGTPGSIMAGDIMEFPGACRKDLTQDDRDALRFLYGATAQ